MGLFLFGWDLAEYFCNDRAAAMKDKNDSSRIDSRLRPIERKPQALHPAGRGTLAESTILKGRPGFGNLVDRDRPLVSRFV